MIAPPVIFGYHTPTLSPNLMLCKVNLYPADKLLVMGSLGIAANVSISKTEDMIDISKIELREGRDSDADRQQQEYSY